MLLSDGYELRAESVLFYYVSVQKNVILILKKCGKCGMILRLSAQAAATSGHKQKASEPIDYRPALSCHKKRFSEACGAAYGVLP